MNLPMTITFRGLPHTEWIEEVVRKRVAKLETFCHDLMSCRVVIEKPHRHHHLGNRFSVRIDMTLRNAEIAITRAGNLHGAVRDLEGEEWLKQFEVEAARKDLLVVIADAFNVARRRLQNQIRRRRLDVKHHEEPLHGRVRRWSPLDQFGVIEASDGHEVYFHVNSVLGSGVRRLRVGVDVIFVEERGDKGPQASTVKLLRGREREEAHNGAVARGAQL